VNLGASLRYAGELRALAVAFAAPGTAPAPAPPPAAGTGVAAGDGTRWVTVQKSFGPVYLDRVGLRYADGVAWFVLDAVLTAAGLTLSTRGLALGSPLDRFAPEFGLDGVGIDYRGGEVEVGGVLAWEERTLADGRTYDAYTGAAVVRTQQLALAALAAYACPPGADPSLFVYGILGYPLGGPAFCFVTGLAAGFGYNQSLRIPALHEVRSFPLVAAATGSAAHPQSPTGLAGWWTWARWRERSRRSSGVLRWTPPPSRCSWSTVWTRWCSGAAELEASGSPTAPLAAKRLAREAAELEETVEKHPVMPGLLLPARELEGDLLLDLARPANALRSFEQTLRRGPNRARTLFGAACAAELAGNAAAARRYYEQVITLMRATPTRSGRSPPRRVRSWRSADARSSSSTTNPRSCAGRGVSSRSS
jgi:tetratricopeptide (TPR) repeat protein